MKNKKIKLLIFIPNLNGGGAERVLTNYLNLFDLDKFEICLAMSSLEGKYIKEIPEVISIVNFNKKKTIFCILQLWVLVRKFKPDLVYSTLARTHAVLYFVMLFVSRHTTIVLRSPNSPKQYMQDQPVGVLFRFLLTKSYKRASLIISQTQEMKNEISKYHFADPEKIKVIHNPVNKKLITAKLEGVTSPFSDDSINIVAAGRLTEQKGFDILIKAFSVVNKVDARFKLSILGGFEGEQSDELQSLVLELDLTETISFLGFQSNPYQYFKYADSYVLSSRWEGLPNTVLECLYIGTPVISTNCIAVMEELIADGVNGFIVDVDNVNQLADAILKCKEIVALNNEEPSLEFDINQLFLDLTE